MSWTCCWWRGGSAGSEPSPATSWFRACLSCRFGLWSSRCRRNFAGANWSAAIKNPFRSFGATGEGLEAALNQQRAGRNEPIVFVLHLAHSRVEYTDRGKSAIVIGGAA